MYDHHIGKNKFYEIKALIHGYMDYGKDYNGLSAEEISIRAHTYYESGELSSSQYDYVIALIEDLE